MSWCTCVQDLDPTVRISKQQQLIALQQALNAKQQQMKNAKIDQRYKKIKFFGMGWGGVV